MTTGQTANFYFELLFKGEKIAFQEVSGISKDISVEDIAEGGEDRFNYKVPRITRQNLTLKKGIVPMASSLAAWCNNTITGGLADKIELNTVLLSLVDANGKVCIKWIFHNAYPVKFDVDVLKAAENQLLMASLELAYTFCQTVTNEF